MLRTIQSSIVFKINGGMGFSTKYFGLESSLKELRSWIRKEYKQFSKAFMDRSQVVFRGCPVNVK